MDIIQLSTWFKNVKKKLTEKQLLIATEIMKEIEGIFEGANDQLLDGLEDIRKEQVRDDGIQATKLNNYCL